MSVNNLKERYATAKQRVRDLKDLLCERRARLLDKDVATYARSSRCSTVRFRPGDLLCCRTLQGHTGKIYSLDWSSEKNRIVSASQDGQLIVWNALTRQKTHTIKLPCAWVMSSTFSPSGHAVACGGLDNMCSIFVLSSDKEKDGNWVPFRALNGHKGYVSCCHYVPDHETQLITSSGDGTCALWDTETGQRISVFGGDTPLGHSSDVVSLSISNANSRVFVSGSCDSTACLWDTRIASRAIRTFYGHEGDVNAVQFFPGGLRFATGSDGGTCRVFDMRSGYQLQLYKKIDNDSQVDSVTSIVLSYSGRLLFAAYTNGDCYIWDTITAEVTLNLGSQRNAHTSRVSCLGLASDGSALCSGSWDKTLKIWAFGGHRTVI